MIRNAIVILLGCLYVAGSAWLVVGEGETYRETLRRERLPAARADESHPPVHPDEVSPAVATSIDAPPGPAETEAPSKVPSVPVAPVQPAMPARSVLAPAPSKTALAEPKPTPTTPAPAPPADRRDGRRNRPREPAGGSRLVLGTTPSQRVMEPDPPECPG